MERSEDSPSVAVFRACQVEQNANPSGSPFKRDHKSVWYMTLRFTKKKVGVDDKLEYYIAKSCILRYEANLHFYEPESISPF